MQLKQLVEKAKKGDKIAFVELVKYYEEYFADMVVRKNNNERLRSKAKEKLPELLKIYLKRNYTQPIHDYLNYYSTSYFTDKIRLSDTRDMNLDKLKYIYTKRLFESFKKINSVLTEDELYSYTYNLISVVIDNLSNDRETLATKLGTFFARQKRFIKTEEDLLIRYILQEGNNINIINYFENKYMLLLNKYEKEISYIYLAENFRNIVIEVLSELSSNKESIKKAMTKKVHRMHVDYSKEITEVGLNIRNNDKRIEELYNTHSILKKKVYDLYKDKVNIPKKQFIEIIDEKYDVYFNAYVNGVCTKTLNGYILTRFG